MERYFDDKHHRIINEKLYVYLYFMLSLDGNARSNASNEPFRDNDDDAKMNLFFLHKIFVLSVMCKREKERK